MVALYYLARQPFLLTGNDFRFQGVKNVFEQAFDLKASSAFSTRSRVGLLPGAWERKGCSSPHRDGWKSRMSMARPVDNFDFIHADQRPQDQHAGCGADHIQASRVWLATCPKLSPVINACKPRLRLSASAACIIMRRKRIIAIFRSEPDFLCTSVKLSRLNGTA